MSTVVPGGKEFAGALTATLLVGHAENKGISVEIRRSIRPRGERDRWNRNQPSKHVGNSRSGERVTGGRLQGSLREHGKPRVGLREYEPDGDRRAKFPARFLVRNF